MVSGWKNGRGSIRLHPNELSFGNFERKRDRLASEREREILAREREREREMLAREREREMLARDRERDAS